MATKEEILESISKMSVMDLVDLIKEIEEKFANYLKDLIKRKKLFRVGV